MEEFIRQQFENQFMTGGLVIVMFTALLAYMRNVPHAVWLFLKRRLVLTVDVADHDVAFYWVQKWLAQHEYSKRSILLTVSTRVRPAGDNDRYHPDDDDVLSRRDKRGRKIVDIFFSPAPGYHILRFKNRWILLHRERRETEGGKNSELAFRETFTLQTISRDRTLMTDLLKEAQNIAFPPEEKNVSIMRERYSGWTIAQKRLPRSIESVILDEDITRDILEDIETFLNSAAWYKEHGIPYQRGYLLHGPTGNGKTSLVLAMASMYGRDIYISRASATTDDAFQGSMMEVPEHAVVLIEDVDCIFNKREKETDDFLSFSGFINAIDGVAASDGRILFMTTNHPEKLDSALIRPGRIDRKFHLSDATHSQAERFFLRFFPGQGVLAEKFANMVMNDKEDISMAMLQGHLLKYKGAVAKAAHWVRKE